MGRSLRTRDVNSKGCLKIKTTYHSRRAESSLLRCGKMVIERLAAATDPKRNATVMHLSILFLLPCAFNMISLLTRLTYSDPRFAWSSR